MGKGGAGTSGTLVTKSRHRVWLVSLLRRHLLFDVAPGADFETAAHPAERLRRGRGSFATANRTFGRFLQPVGRNGLLRLFQDFRWNYRLQLRLWFPSHSALSSVPIWQKRRPRYNYRPATWVLRRLRNLYYNSNIQGRSTAGAPLPCGYSWIFPFHIDIRWDGMGTNRAVYITDAVVFNKSFHGCFPSSHPTKKSEQRLYQIRKDF